VTQRHRPTETPTKKEKKKKKIVGLLSSLLSKKVLRSYLRVTKGHVRDTRFAGLGKRHVRVQRLPQGPRLRQPPTALHF
jgi:hypothetical protein